MKNGLFCLLTITLISGSVKAQLGHSKWKGVLKLDNPVNVTFNFGKDTLTVFNLDENTILETMIYTATSSTFTLKKISGQSGCESSTIGKYKYKIKAKSLLMTVVEDNCSDRAPYLNNLQLMKDRS
ncbi:hypothetical protein [Segetibacter koreensis]|uniref:hypothetical protein n=1 Tax=Segetibacter koreensis TaxID=398037 RepID=UPI00036DEE9A|nr:hypothetical protein [Segetibacter koreensis]